MIQINKNSNLYPVAANIIATAVGFGASLIVRAVCVYFTNGSNVSNTTKYLMSIGRFGLETSSLYGVSSQVRSDIDDIVDIYNDFAGAANIYKQKTKDSVKVENA